MIAGGYINAELLWVTSAMIVGSIDWSTQISGSGKPSDNADATATVISSGLITTGTLQVIQGGSSTAGITGNSSGDSAVRFWAGGTFADRANARFNVTQDGTATFNSTADSTSLLKFRRSTYNYEFRLSSSGSYLAIAPKQNNCTLAFGDPSLTYKLAAIQGLAKDLNQFSTDDGTDNMTLSIYPNYAQFYVNDSGTTRTYKMDAEAFIGTQAYLGKEAYPWYRSYITRSYVGGYATDLNVRMGIKGSGATGSTYTIYCTNSADSIAFYVNDLRQVYAYALISTAVYPTYAMVGGATYNSTVRLGVKGSGTGSSTYSILTVDSADTIRFYVRDDGQAYGYGWNNISDRRLKENITPIQDEALPKVMKLNPSEFDFFADTEKRRKTGHIAQDVFLAIPEICTEPTEDIPFMGYSLDGLVAYHIKATQEIFERLTKLEDKVNGK